jgi:hypothetical protein
LPFKELVSEVVEGIGLDKKKIVVVTQSSVFEDNAGAIVVARSPRMTPTSKFIAVKYHWFRDHIDTNGNKSKPIKILKIDGKVNPADIFTKCKSVAKEFRVLRFLLCRW